MNTPTRISLWFGSVLVSVAVFSLAFSIMLSGGGAYFLIFRITSLFAFPASCLYLPFVISLKDAEEQRSWQILISGTLAGPAVLALWFLVLQLKGSDTHLIWVGDPLTGIGGIAGGLFALIVSFLTTCCYLIGLKVFHRRPALSRENA